MPVAPTTVPPTTAVVAAIPVLPPTTVPTTPPTTAPPTPAPPVHRVSAAEVDPPVQATETGPLDNPVVVLTLVVVVVAAGIAGSKASSGRD
jgi:hypothetical protein